MHKTEDLRLRVGVPGEARHDRPPWVLCHDKEFSVVTELAHPVS